MESYDVPRPVWVERTVLDLAIDITETLVNLNYLINIDGDDPRRVHGYLDSSEERLHTLARLLQSIYPA